MDTRDTLTQVNVRLQDILNRLVRTESRLTRFSEEMGVDTRLKFLGRPRNPRKDPLVVEIPEIDSDTLMGVLEALLDRAVSVETLLCSTMNLHGVSPQNEPRQMNALRHYQRTQR